MKEIAIKVENVNKIYKLYDKPSDRLKEALKLTKKKKHTDHIALKNIDIEVKKGETVGIIGTNGSGKSTILKIITGVLNPTTGSVFIKGRISALLELGAGFNMEYTGIENVYLNGTMIGFSKEEIDERLDKILEFADIGEFVNQPVKTYSSGMFVRLAFAVAINIDPEILIVDEALSVGDVFFQAKCYKKFEDFKKAGKTIIFVSHDLSSISKYCDRVILLNKGNKLAEGNSKEMVDLYKKVLVNQNEEKIENVAHNADLEWKSLLNNNPENIEYGDNKASIIDYSIEDKEGNISSTLIKDERFTIRIRVKFNEDIDFPIFAFTIKNLKGIEITGTNTMFEDKIISYVKKDEIKEVVFEQNMSLQGGEYLLSFGCTGYEGDKFVVYHRLYDACNMTVISDKNTVGFYDMNSYIEIK